MITIHKYGCRCGKCRKTLLQVSAKKFLWCFIVRPKGSSKIIIRGGSGK
jgi:hypothetical protein